MGWTHIKNVSKNKEKHRRNTRGEQKMSSQSKAVNHMIQGQQSSYYPIKFGYSQAMIPGPSPSHSYGPIAIYDPNQWRQN
jgi:hypothetical protein